MILKTPVRSTALVLSIILISMTFAPGKTYPWDYIPGARYLWGLAFLATCFLAVVQDFDAEWFWRILKRSWTVAGIWGINGLLFLYSWKHYKETAGYEFPIVPLILLVVSAPLIPKILRERRVDYLLGLNILLLIGSIYHFPLRVARSDMLPVISSALKQRADGIGLYNMADMGGYETMAHYFPINIMSHLPAFLLGIDLRWNTVLYRAISFFLILPLLEKQKNRDEVFVLCLLFFMNPYWIFRHDLYYEIYLLFIALYWVFPKAQGALMPLMLLTRHFALIFIPFAGLQWLRKQADRKFFLFSLVVGILITAAGLYWFMSAGDWSRYYETRNFLSQVTGAEDYAHADYGLSITYLLRSWAIRKAGFYFAALAGVVAGALALLKKGYRRPLQFVLPMAVLTIGANFHYWSYFWICSVFWLFMGLALHPEEFENITAEKPSAPISANVS